MVKVTSPRPGALRERVLDLVVALVPLSHLALRMKRYLPFAIIFFVALAALGGGTLLYRAKRETVLAPVPAELASAKPGAPTPHFRGAAKAPIVLEEFGDLQCPPCASFSVALKKIEHDYQGRLRVVFRQFPMPMHQHAVAAARATEAAGAQGRFWEMSDLH
jgi:protein-disulfide isomerase